ncbi:MAG: alpha/beta hydrolase [Chloroflexi bacterium]|nr:alpha/beta hydrolase [Chloroflexota bacterium]
MPKVDLNGVGIYYEETGEGFPLVFAHELAGNTESWKAQVSYFSRRYRVITYNARGYPPSDVPEVLDDYSQEQVVEDLYLLLQHLGVKQAHIGGLSMGGNMTLFFGLRHPEMAKSLIVAGAGTGSTDPALFKQQSEAYAAQLEAKGTAGFGDYLTGPTRVRFKQKDPTGWAEFARLFSEHSAIGKALTLRGYQARRPSVMSLETELQALQVPTLIILGDEDDPCLEPALFMKRNIPRSGLVVVPQTGHAVNLEEPEIFNRSVSDFLSAVDAGKWETRSSGSGVGFGVKS